MDLDEIPPVKSFSGSDLGSTLSSKPSREIDLAEILPPKSF
jgi:hypothetical protein